MPARGGCPAPAGLLALGGVLAAVLLAAVVLVACGGDDGEDDGSGSASSSGEDDATGTGTFDGELGGDAPPAASFPVELSAGQALRAVVREADTGVQLAVEEDAITDGFAGLLAVDGDEQVIEDATTRQLLIFAQAVIDDDTYLDLEDEWFEDRLDAEELEAAVAEAAPEAVEAGPIVVGSDRTCCGDPDGIMFVAPADGTYTLLIATDDSSGEEFEVTIDVEDGSDDGLDEDAIDYLEYLGHYGEHVEFFCDEEFWGGDPVEVTNYGPSVCDPDALAGVMSGQSGDFTNDFGRGPEE